MPIFIPDLFSGYVEGRRKAIQDNWTDLTNYNSVLGGQLQNAFNMETFDDNVSMSRDNAQNSRANTAYNSLAIDNMIAQLLEERKLGVPSAAANARLASIMDAISTGNYNVNLRNDPRYKDAQFARYGTNGTTSTTTGNGTGQTTLDPMQGTGKEPQQQPATPQQSNQPTVQPNQRAADYPRDLALNFPNDNFNADQIAYLRAAGRRIAEQKASQGLTGAALSPTVQELEQYMATNPQLFPNRQ